MILLFLQSTSTPPYVIRETTRINALENTVQRIASDLSSSKDQLREVKELLLRLINSDTPPNPSFAVRIETPTVPGHTHSVPIPDFQIRTPMTESVPTVDGVSGNQRTQRESSVRMHEVERHPTPQA